MRKIGFIGAYDKTDMLLNIAKILTTMSKKVLIIDSTINQKAKYVVPMINPTISYVTFFEDIDVAVGFNTLEDIERYLGISTLALIPMNQAEEEVASSRRSPRKGKEKVVLGADDEKARSFKSSDINKNTNNKNSNRNADGIEFMED